MMIRDVSGVYCSKAQVTLGPREGTAKEKKIKSL